MSDNRILFTKAWLKKAENDLVSANQILTLADGPTDTPCFHAQQAVEKAFKAFLTFHDIEFPKIHALDRLLELCLPRAQALHALRKEIIELSVYAVETRYPGDFFEPERKEAKDAVDNAEKIVDIITDLLKNNFGHENDD